jgi:hypothetical protein
MKTYPLLKHHAIKTCWVSGDIAPRILTLSTRWRWMVGSMPRPPYPRRNNPRYLLERRLGGTQSRSWCTGRENKNPSPCRESNLGRRVRSLVTNWLHWDKYYRNLLIILSPERRGSSVGIVTRLRAGLPEIQFSAREQIFFSSLSRPDWLRAHLPSYPTGTGSSILGVMRPGCEADHSPSYSVEYKNARIYTSTSETASLRGA